MLGCSSDKPATAILRELAQVAGRVIAVRPRSPRAADPEELASAAAALGLPASSAGDVASGLAAAAGAPLAVVTGSLFAVGDAREALGLAQPDLEWGPGLSDG